MEKSWFKLDMLKKKKRISIRRGFKDKLSCQPELRLEKVIWPEVRKNKYSHRKNSEPQKGDRRRAEKENEGISVFLGGTGRGKKVTGSKSIPFRCEFRSGGGLCVLINSKRNNRLENTVNKLCDWGVGTGESLHSEKNAPLERRKEKERTRR